MLVTICHRMDGAFGYEDGFLAFRLCLIQWLEHTIRHKVIFVAVDKEHRFGALPYLLLLLAAAASPVPPLPV